VINHAQIRCLSVLGIFAIIGFGPVSICCLLGVYIILRRPGWFLTLIRDVYAGRHPRRAHVTTAQSGLIRLKAFMVLLLLFTVDILPVPVTATIAIVITLNRPQWFYHAVHGIYG
jgi:hypothetical protein